MALEYEKKVPIPPHTVKVPNGDKVYIQCVFVLIETKKESPTISVCLLGSWIPKVGS